jgi:hypothetical protein
MLLLQAEVVAVVFLQLMHQLQLLVEDGTPLLVFLEQPLVPQVLLLLPLRLWVVEAEAAVLLLELQLQLPAVMVVHMVLEVEAVVHLPLDSSQAQEELAQPVLSSSSQISRKEVSMDTVDEVLEHVGVRGMKWGVRNDTIAVSSVDRRARGSKPIIGNYGNGPAPDKAEVKHLTKASAVALSGIRSLDSFKQIDEFNTNIKSMHKTPYVVWTPAQQKSYDKQIAGILEGHANHALKSPFVASVHATSTGEMILAVGSKPVIDQWKKSIAHADGIGVMTTMLKPIRDTQGLITGFIEGDSMMQSDLETIDDVLEHVGIRGMHWGVRRDNPSSGGTSPGASSPSTGGKRFASFRSRETRVKVGDELKTVKVPPHTSTDAMKAHNAAVQIRRHGLKAVTNQELKDLNYRIDMEQKFKTAMAKERENTKKKQGRISRGKDVVEKLMWSSGELALKPYIEKASAEGLAKVVAKTIPKLVL